MNGRPSKSWLHPTTEADVIVKQVAQATPGAENYAPSDALCDEKICAFGDEVPHYVEYQHLSRLGAAHTLARMKL